MKNDKGKLKIRIISTFLEKERADILLNVFGYLLIKLPEELKKQKLIKRAVEKSANYN